MDELKQKRDLGWIRLVWPVAMAIVGLIMLIAFFTIGENPSGFVFIAGIAFIVVGVLFFRHYWIRRGDSEGRVIVVKSNADSGPQNCLNIYPDKIIFESMTSPEGQPWKCENNNKSYYIHIWDEEINRLKEFKLPDQTYMDPQVFAQRVLELPAHRRIFRRKQTLLQQLSPLMALGGIGIIWILIITTT